ncbi:response regulator [Aureimonas psammosilenae]|jgi:DNA-binding LytR/AlgR family response regulator|uniref:response regulator n=1 Tax=Aureimonas psammosilenae TaxID=2495496 RepID=UPI00186A5984|nr:response regulator [Aureimonas psammosilenae]
MTITGDFTDLDGKRVLIVEDEYFIAVEMVEAVRRAGGIPLGPAPDVGQALTIASGEGVDAAVLDIRLGDETSFPIARVLEDRGVPVVFVTGYDDWFIPNDLDDVPVYRKPTDPDNVVRLLFDAVKKRPA